MNRRSFFRSMLGLPLLPFVAIPEGSLTLTANQRLCGECDPNIGLYLDSNREIKLSAGGMPVKGTALFLDRRSGGVYRYYADQKWRKVALV